MMIVERNDCRCCRGMAFQEVFALGNQPYSNSFLSSPDEYETFSPLTLMECEDCGHVQLQHVVDAKSLYKNYSFQTGMSHRMTEHFFKLMEVSVERYVEQGGLVVEVGSNDGTALASIQRADVRRIGCDPAENLASVAEQRGVKIVPRFFNEETARNIADEHGTADLIVACNVLAHIDDLDGFCRGVQVLLSEKGRLVVEVPQVERLIEQTEFDTIYHEHLSYFSVRSMSHLFQRHGLFINCVLPVEVHGGSIRLTISRYDDKELHSLAKHRKRDWMGFGKRCKFVRETLVRCLEEQRDLGRIAWGYGAPAKGSVLLNYCGIGCDLLPVVVDSTPTKQRRYVPGTHQPILHPDELLLQHPDIAVVLAWNHFAEIQAKETEYLRSGGRFVLPTEDFGTKRQPVDTSATVN